MLDQAERVGDRLAERFGPRGRDERQALAHQQRVAEQLAARISEASGFFPLEQLALSTQCGFASAGPGNQISEDAQENKLRLVGEVADRVWG